MKIWFRYVYVLFMVGVWIPVMSCASAPETRFYVLSPMSLPEIGQKPEKPPCVSIGLGPVKIPEYLARTGIVTTVTENEIIVGGLYKWAEPLEENLPRVLAENLSSLLCLKNVFILPSGGASSLDYQIRVQVIRMDGKLGDTAVLDVAWMLQGSKEVLVEKRSNYQQNTRGKGYEEFVFAQSQNVASFSREIAKAILAHPK